MADGRRHSVDIPISKTLVALRRVRSLRDPSTNSMSKFSALFDNLNWETNSLNGISLCSVNGCPKVGSDNDGLLGLKNLGYNGQLEEHFSDLDFYYNSGRPEFTSIPCKDFGWVGNSVPGLPAPIGTKQVEGLDYNGSTQEGVYGKNTSGDRYCIDSMDKELDLTCITPSSNRLEDVDSCNGPIIGSSPTGRIDYTVSKRKSRYRNQIKSSGVAGDVVSCVGSPCPSISEALLEGSSHSTSLFANEEVDLVDRNHSGCGISCCWSRSPRFRESNLPSDVEEYPLLSGELGMTNIIICVSTSVLDGDFCSTSSTGESLKHLVTCVCDENKSQKFGIRECMETLESTWKRATELCQSSSLKNFLRKQGKLSSVCVNQGLAVAELEFHHPDYVSRAEKSWKLIASSLQTILGCNVEIRINLAPCASVTRYAKVKKPSFSFFSCSLRMQHKSQSTTEQTSDQSDCSDLTSEKAMIRDKPIESCSSDCGPQISHICYHRTNAATTIRNSEGNALSMGRATPFRSVQDDMPMGPGVGIDFSKEEGSDHGCRVLTIQEPEFQPNCFFRAARFSKRLQSSDSSQLVGLRTQPQNKHALSIPKKTSFKTYCCANDCYIFCCGSNNCTNSSRDIEGPREDSKVHCWKVPSPLRKAWQLRHQRKRSHLVGWVLPCAATK
ncbi:hypothetical protein L1049_027670 [Liquidambar formosana]|uniref:STICHEL DnaA-N-like alpha-beta domain-containing protein n=1 Tax=Liquidambar formosana TaxID=63359 RepID=A0AAP0RHT3_LIQFO